MHVNKSSVLRYCIMHMCSWWQVRTVRGHGLCLTLLCCFEPVSLLWCRQLQKHLPKVLVLPELNRIHLFLYIPQCKCFSSWASVLASMQTVHSCGTPSSIYICLQVSLSFCALFTGQWREKKHFNHIIMFKTSYENSTYHISACWISRKQIQLQKNMLQAI